MKPDADARRRLRQRTWTAQVYRGSGVHAAMEADDLDEWAALDPVERLAMSWALSLEQLGVANDGTLPLRLPRSAYRLERR